MLHKLGFPARSQILKQLGPWLQSCTLDDLCERGPQVGVLPAAGTLSCGSKSLVNDIDLSRIRQLKGFLEEGPQFGEERNSPSRLTRVVLCLWLVDHDSVRLPVDIFPLQ